MRTPLLLWGLCLSCAQAGIVRKTLEEFDAAAATGGGYWPAPGTVAS